MAKANTTQTRQHGNCENSHDARYPYRPKTHCVLLDPSCATCRLEPTTHLHPPNGTILVSLTIYVIE